MFPHDLTCAGRVATYRTSDAIRTATIAWTRVHAIIKSITCAKGRLKSRRSDGWSSSRDDCDRTAGGGLTSWSWCTGSVNRDCSSNWSYRTATKTRGRTPRSRSDRTAIEPRSWKFWRGIASTGSDGGQLLTSTTIDARSWRDRVTIVAKMVANRKLFWSKIVADSKPIRKLRPRQVKPLPRRINSAPTTASIGHDLRANSPP